MGFIMLELQKVHIQWPLFYYKEEKNSLGICLQIQSGEWRSGWWGGESWCATGWELQSTRRHVAPTHQHISTQATHKNSIYTFYTDHEYYDGLGSIGRTKHFLMNVIQILKSSPMEMVLTLVTISICSNVNKSQVFSFRY